MPNSDPVFGECKVCKVVKERQADFTFSCADKKRPVKKTGLYCPKVNF